MARNNDLPCNIGDVVQLLGITVVRNTGTRMDCRCPFCDDRSAHLDVKLTDNVFRCHRCGKGGGVLHLYAEFHGITLGAAGEELRSLFGPNGELSERRTTNPVKKQIIASEETQLATVEERDNTYTNLLSMLTLAPTHRESLQRRGLNEEDIEWVGYKTTPAFRTMRLAMDLQQRGCVLEGVPGFYCDRETGRWRLDIRGGGIMIPDRNADGQIEAIQIRLDKVVKSKFNNLTSAERYCGISAHCCPHFVGVAPWTKTVYLTEGVMKSDIAYRLSMRMGTPRAFVGLTGVSNHSQLMRAIEELKIIGVDKIVVAFDSDYQTKQTVEEAREKAVQECLKAGFEVVPLSWTKDYKGIDDLLLHFNELEVNPTTTIYRSDS